MKTLLLLLVCGCGIDARGFGGEYAGRAGILVRGAGGAGGIGSVGGVGGAGGGAPIGTGGVAVGSGGGLGGRGVPPDGTGGTVSGSGGGSGVTVVRPNSVKVEFTCSTADGRNAVQVWRVTNTTNRVIPMLEWDLIYWYTANEHTPAGPQCDLVNGTACAGAVTISAFTRTLNRPSADSYINLHFTASGLPAVGARLLHLQTSFHYTDFAQIDFTDDYSCELSSADISTWEAAQASLREWSKVGLYQNGVLVWGVEP